MPHAPQEITVRAGARRVRGVLRGLPRLVSGRTGAGRAVQALLIRVGLAALERIKTAFVVKARGGTDEAGERWKPLSPHTIAYSRRHPKITRSGKTSKQWLPRGPARASKAPSYALSEKQRERWWELYRRGLARYKGDKAHAAASAWYVLKAEGAQTLMGLYGGAKVEILRDTGLLLNTLTPGAPAAAGLLYAPRVKQQVFRLGKGDVTVGTQRKWARTHHEGVPGHIPQRRLWPAPAKWPASWWAAITGQAADGVIDIVRHLLSRV